MGISCSSKNNPSAEFQDPLPVQNKVELESTSTSTKGAAKLESNEIKFAKGEYSSEIISTARQSLEQVITCYEADLSKYPNRINLTVNIKLRNGKVTAAKFSSDTTDDTANLEICTEKEFRQ